MPLNMSAQTGAASEALAILDQLERKTREVSAEARRLPTADDPEPTKFPSETAARLTDMPAEERERFRALIAETIAELGEENDKGQGTIVPASTGRGGKRRAGISRINEAIQKASSGISTIRGVATVGGIIAIARKFGGAGIAGGAIGSLVAVGMRAVTQDFHRQAAANRINTASILTISQLMVKSRWSSGREISRLDRISVRAEAAKMSARQLAVGGLGPLESILSVTGFGGVVEEEAAQAMKREQQISLLQRELSSQGISEQTLGSQATRRLEVALRGDMIEIENKMGRRGLGTTGLIRYYTSKAWGAVYGQAYMGRERSALAQERSIKILESLRADLEAETFDKTSRPEYRTQKNEMERHMARVNRWKLERFMDWNRS